jgi:hypothetical protein
MTFRKKLLPSSGPTVKNPDIHTLALTRVPHRTNHKRQVSGSGFLTVGPEEGRRFFPNVLFFSVLFWCDTGKSSGRSIRDVQPLSKTVMLQRDLYVCIKRYYIYVAVFFS